MKKILKTALLAALLLSMTSCSTMMRTMMEKKMFRHYISSLDFDSTYEAIHQGIVESEYWTLLDEVDNDERYAPYADIGPYQILMVCVPSTAVKILENEDTKFMGAMIPLKFCLYELEDGTVKISLMNVEMMGRMFKDKSVQAEIKAAVAEMETIIAQVL